MFDKRRSSMDMCLCSAMQDKAEEDVGTDVAMDLAAENTEDRPKQRASRTMLSATTSVPQQLLDDFAIPPGCAISRTIHVDTCLPHFQGRLPAGKFHEGKNLSNIIICFLSPTLNQNSCSH